MERPWGRKDGPAMTAIARQIPQARRVSAAFHGSPKGTDCSQWSITDTAPAADVSAENDRRAALAEYSWVEEAALAGSRVPRG